MLKSKLVDVIVENVLYEVTTRDAAASFRKNEAILKKVGALNQVKLEIQNIISSQNLTENLRDSFFLMAIHYEAQSFAPLASHMDLVAKTGGILPESENKLKERIFEKIPERIAKIYQTFSSYVGQSTVQHPGISDEDGQRPTEASQQRAFAANEKVLLHLSSLAKAILRKNPLFDGILKRLSALPDYFPKLNRAKEDPMEVLDLIYSRFLRNGVILDMDIPLEEEAKKYFAGYFAMLKRKYGNRIREILAERDPQN